VLDDVCVLERKSAEFFCQVFPPDAEVTWFFNGQQLLEEDNDRFHISEVNGRHHLVILETSKADEGQISACVGDCMCHAELSGEGLYSVSALCVLF
jgi:hypothetical protein